MLKPPACGDLRRDNQEEARAKFQLSQLIKQTSERSAFCPLNSALLAFWLIIAETQIEKDGPKSVGESNLVIQNDVLTKAPRQFLWRTPECLAVEEE